MNPTARFKLEHRPAAILAVLALAIGAALGASTVALAATHTHRHSSLRRCTNKRARLRAPRRCGHAARYRPSHHRRPSNLRRNLPVHKTSVAPPSSTAAAQSSAPAPTSCTNTELVPTSANIAEVRAATLCLINRERGLHGESPLTEDPRLLAAAQGHSEDMVARDYFSHTTPTGEAFDARILASGYARRDQEYMLGENIDCGTLYLATPSATVSAWMNSPEHRENILNGEYRETGMGVAAAAPASFADGQAGATYTQDFGVIA
ncbi:MAG TPA: CAP domain-containing protein [Solirubrobacteraceae bacterium]|nr:CAP domain-containing protein [Solirubrobacteraceae bacterium]